MELLAPAGDLEKLKIAVDYGADAVYFGGEMFSLRAGAGNLSVAEIEEGTEYAHEHGVKCYLTLNVFAHNEDIVPFRQYLESIRHIPIDAFIVSDPGIIEIIKQMIPEAELHLSTQANSTNYVTANFWYRQGVKRLVLARELTFREIKEIRDNIPEDMELEAFVHGAMCISYFRKMSPEQLHDRQGRQQRTVRTSMPLEVQACGGTAPRRILSRRGRRQGYIHPEFQGSVHA